MPSATMKVPYVGSPTPTIADLPLLWRADAGEVVDLAMATRHLAGVDPMLGGLIQQVGPFTGKAPRGLTLFQFLVRAISGQQLSVKAAQTIHGRLIALHAPKSLTPARVLGTDESRLRGAGLSRAK